MRGHTEDCEPSVGGSGSSSQEQEGGCTFQIMKRQLYKVDGSYFTADPFDTLLEPEGITTGRRYVIVAEQRYRLGLVRAEERSLWAGCGIRVCLRYADTGELVTQKRQTGGPGGGDNPPFVMFADALGGRPSPCVSMEGTIQEDGEASFSFALAATSFMHGRQWFDLHVESACPTLPVVGVLRVYIKARGAQGFRPMLGKKPPVCRPAPPNTSSSPPDQSSAPGSRSRSPAVACDSDEGVQLGEDAAPALKRVRRAGPPPPAPAPAAAAPAARPATAPAVPAAAVTRPFFDLGAAITITPPMAPAAKLQAAPSGPSPFGVFIGSPFGYGPAAAPQADPFGCGLMALAPVDGLSLPPDAAVQPQWTPNPSAKPVFLGRCLPPLGAVAAQPVKRPHPQQPQSAPQLVPIQFYPGSIPGWPASILDLGLAPW